MKALNSKCKTSVQLFAYNYTINVLSKCDNIISHRSSVFEGRHNDHQSSKVGTSTINLRRSTHRSSIHIDLRRSHRSWKIESGNIAPTTQHLTDIPTIRHRILSTTALHSYIPFASKSAQFCALFQYFQAPCTS